MVERIKRGMLAIGVCFPIYLVLYTALYGIERLWLPADRWFAGPVLFGVGIALALRVAWMFGRAALRGGPVLVVPPEPVVVAPILPIAAGPEGPAEVEPEPAPGGAPARPRLQSEAAGELVRELVPGTQPG